MTFVPYSITQLAKTYLKRQKHLLTFAGSLSVAEVLTTEPCTGRYSEIVTLYMLEVNTGAFGFLKTLMVTLAVSDFGTALVPGLSVARTVICNV